MASEEKIPENKRFIGDVVNGLVIVNTLVYIGFVVANANGFGVKFSPSFAQDGFCVSNKARIYLQLDKTFKQNRLQLVHSTLQK